MHLSNGVLSDLSNEALDCIPLFAKRLIARDCMAHLHELSVKSLIRTAHWRYTASSRHSFEQVANTLSAYIIPGPPSLPSILAPTLLQNHLACLNPQSRYIAAGLCIDGWHDPTLSNHGTLHLTDIPHIPRMEHLQGLRGDLES